MSSKPKLVFFGNERLATGVSTDAPVLRSLIKAGYDVRAVVAGHTQGISRQRRGLEIAESAQFHQIPILIPDKLEDIYDQLVSYEAEAAVLVAFGKIIPQKIIDIFPKGIINIHPSLLPAYRGPTPIETAILEGAGQTGVSLMSLSAKMDAGPVYAQEKLSLKGGETKPALARQLLNLGAKLLIENLPSILDGSLEALPQNSEQATYTRLLSKADSATNFKEAADLIERKVRAFALFPKLHAGVYGQEIIITKARVAKDEADGKLVLKCQPGWLEITELTGPSGRSMTGADFIRGYKKS